MKDYALFLSLTFCFCFIASNRLSNLSISSAEKKADKDRLLNISRKLRKSNSEAGFNLLAWNQKIWQDCHAESEHNANLADKIGNYLNYVEAFSHRYANSVQEFVAQMDGLKSIEDQIDWVMNDIFTCQRFVTQLESLLTKLNEEKERKMFAQLESDLNVQLNNYKEFKNGELEAVKVRLSNQHFKMMKEVEKKEEMRLKMRQEVFQAAFEKELNDYKMFGKVESKNDGQEVMVKTLEEIEIEPNEEDQTALSQFLAEES